MPDYVFAMLPNKESPTFKVTPCFFNIGINEYATLSETLGYTRDQHRSNWDNFDRLKQYHIRYKKIMLNAQSITSKSESLNETMYKVGELLTSMEESLRRNASKNTKILHLAEDICRGLHGLRFTSCKSAKDRTAMAVTLEQCQILQKEFHLPANNVQSVLDTMRRFVNMAHIFCEPPFVDGTNENTNMNLKTKKKLFTSIISVKERALRIH